MVLLNDIEESLLKLKSDAEKCNNNDLNTIFSLIKNKNWCMLIKYRINIKIFFYDW